MAVSRGRLEARVITGAVALLVVIAVALGASPLAARATTMTQAEAPALPLLTADPHAGGGEVPNFDTQAPSTAVTPNNAILLIAALGVLIGVLVVTRRRSGPKP